MVCTRVCAAASTVILPVYSFNVGEDDKAWIGDRMPRGDAVARERSQKSMAR